MIEGETLLVADDKDMINVSGKEDEPLWVDRNEIAAVGVFGPSDSLVVLKTSGMKLRAKHIHPNELIGIIMEREENGDADSVRTD